MTVLVVPLLVSLTGCMMLWHRCDCGDGIVDDIWAIVALAPLFFLIVMAALQ